MPMTVLGRSAIVASLIPAVPTARDVNIRGY